MRERESKLRFEANGDLALSRLSLRAAGSTKSRNRLLAVAVIAFLFGLLTLLNVNDAWARTTCNPQNLVHIRVANITPGLGPTSFAAQAKEYYRIRSDKLRIQEAMDTDNLVHELVVISEPNIWMINLYDMTGKHILDPGPTFFARAPLFAPGRIGAKFADLEFGCESDFIAANAPRPVRTELVGHDKFDVYRVNDGADAIEILERVGSRTPAFARYYRGGTLLIALKYLLYLTNLPNDYKLFSPPSNVQFSKGR